MQRVPGGGLQPWSPAPQADTLSLVSRPDSSQLRGQEARRGTGLSSSDRPCPEPWTEIRDRREAGEGRRGERVTGTRSADSGPAAGEQGARAVWTC